jgi:hypothetical protein
MTTVCAGSERLQGWQWRRLKGRFRGLPNIADADGRRTIDHFAMRIERPPVHRAVAGAARPGEVPATVATARRVADEDLALPSCARSGSA